MGEDRCATLDEEVKEAPWANFDNKPKVTYEAVSRFGWPDVGMDGGGDPDWVDYRIVKAKKEG